MQVCEGEGWRWLVEPARHPFCVLAGGEGWAVELTAAEAAALSQGLVRLVAEHRQLVDQLMPEEAISLELEQGLEQGGLWIGLEGHREAWELRFVLTPAPALRGVEGRWSAAASAALVAALAQTAASDSMSALPHGRG